MFPHDILFLKFPVFVFFCGGHRVVEANDNRFRDNENGVILQEKNWFIRLGGNNERMIIPQVNDN